MSSLNKRVYIFPDGGRELYFPAYYFYAEKRLVNHWIKSMTVKDLDECEYRCYLDANCVSLNIKNKDHYSGTHECELNNSTHLDHDRNLKDNHLYYHRGAEVSDYHFLFNFSPSVVNKPIYTKALHENLNICT